MSALPFTVVCGEARAEAEDEASALLAARTLRRDAVDDPKNRGPVIHVLYEGEAVLTIDPTRCL